MTIVVLDGYTLNPGDNPWIELDKLGQVTFYDRTPVSQIVERARSPEIILTNKAPLNAGILDHLPLLKFIAVTATGINVVDAVAAARRSIPVANVPVYGTTTVAQHTFALILELCNHVGLHADSVRAGGWTACTDWCYWKSPLLGLDGRTIPDAFCEKRAVRVHE